MMIEEKKDDSGFVRPTFGKQTVAGSADKKAKRLADKWIKELSEIGCTPDEMIAIFRMARKKLESIYESRK